MNREQSSSNDLKFLTIEDRKQADKELSKHFGLNDKDICGIITGNAIIDIYNALRALTANTKSGRYKISFYYDAGFPFVPVTIEDAFKDCNVNL